MTPEKYKDETWDKFFDFLATERPLNDDEVRAQLKSRGLDTAKAISSVKDALAQAQARAGLKMAADRFEALSADIPMTHSVDGDLREVIRKRIEKHSGKPSQMTFFRKLEAAASDEDLQSLLDDLNFLDNLNGENGDVA